MASDDWTPNFGTLDAPPPTWAAKRPVRIALLGDFGGGAAAGRLDTGAELARRKPISVEADTLEQALARQDVTLRVPVGAGGLPVDIALADLDAFHPDTLYREQALFRQLADLRKRLNNTASFAKAAAEVQKMAGGSKRRASRVARGVRARGATPSPGARLDDFARLTGRASATAQAAGGVEALLRDVISPFVVPAPQPEQKALLATLDSAIADLMRALLHHPDFQTTESLWRGVDFLLRRLETGPVLQVHLIDVSAEEFAADLSADDDLAETGLYRLLVSKAGESKDGGYTTIAGLYQFEATPPHAELLGRMAKIAQAAGAPFITAIHTDALATGKKPPHPLVHAAFTALRELPEAGRLALLGPRFLLRHPYGKRSDPISSFAFEEFTAADGLGGMLWGHPALLALTVLAGQGGNAQVADLPFHHYVDADGDSTALPCTERWMSVTDAAQLWRYGITTLMAHKGEPTVRVNGLSGLDGQALGAAGATRQAARTGVEFKLAGRMPEGSHSSPAAARSDDDSPSDTDTSDLDALSDSSDDSSSGDDSGSSDLDSLLASLGDSANEDSSGDSDSGGSDMDAELAELLKSLG